MSIQNKKQYFSENLIQSLTKPILVGGLVVSYSYYMGRNQYSTARRERAVLCAVSAPFSAPGNARAARRATCRGAPCARRVRAACARGAGRSGLSLLAQVSQSSAVGRAAGGRRHARRGPQVRRASPAHLRALARLEPKPGRREVPPGFAVRFRRQKESEAKHTKKTRRFKSQARACARTYCCRKFLESEVVAEGVGNFSPKPNNI